MQKENKVIVKLNCFPGPCRTGENRGSRFFVSDRRSSVRSKIGRCRITTFRQNTDFNVGLTPDLHAKHHGFTLIELLVVVLIIGILAAVAVPQYTLAVNKARFANLRSIAQPYIKAMETYHLANGEWPDNFDELSVDAPAGLTVIHTDSPHRSCVYNNDFFCCIRKKDETWATSVTCGRADYSFSYIYLLDTIDEMSIAREKDLCAAKATDTNADKLCKSFGGTFFKNTSTNSPTGNQTNYNYYFVNR